VWLIVWKRYVIKDILKKEGKSINEDRLNGGKSAIMPCIGDNDEYEINVN
jgi:hypothetical protein